MTGGWYSITPTGPVTIGNLTPVGQNSGQVGCRWPPNGHQLAACLDLPKPIKNSQGEQQSIGCQLWGPFWYNGEELYVVLPLPVYVTPSLEPNEVPEEIFRCQWGDRREIGSEHQPTANDETAREMTRGRWEIRSEHQSSDDDETTAEIEMIGGRFLIGGETLVDFWNRGHVESAGLQKFPWKELTLSHNSREEFQVKDENGFFAEMTTLLEPGWSILVKVIDEENCYDKPESWWSVLGAGGTPVLITRLEEGLIEETWLSQNCPNATGAVLLTGALWPKANEKISLPYPQTGGTTLKGYAAETGIPWQSRSQRKTRRALALTPGEWMTPAGAVYLWDGPAPAQQSGPFSPAFKFDALGYGHLWLFDNQLEESE
ncbi:hypothetical protein NG799_01985 [Laspinema sp. D1]|uniref:Tocopherol cyclase n=1 Tax=Laspinema palackyanum D2a TaxID=2953684 RepID=A0ABT2MKU4_9CYAN|nr:hypothetical protein [Laspinema sp. D2a]